MRFLQFVSCGRSASRRTDRESSEGGAQESAPVPASPSPTSSPAAAAAASPREKRLGRAAAGYSQWRPTLGAISENGALRAVAAAKQMGGTQRPASQAGKAQAPTPVARAPRRRDYLDDHRHFTAPPVIPAFVPAAFLF